MKKFVEGLVQIIFTIILWVVMFGCVFLGLWANHVELGAGWYILIGIATLAISTAIMDDEGY